MKKFILILVLVLLLSACSSAPKVREIEHESGLVKISVYYKLPAEDQHDIPADCLIPLLTKYYEIDMDFEGRERGWMIVRSDQCAGFARARRE